MSQTLIQANSTTFQNQYHLKLIFSLPKLCSIPHATTKDFYNLIKTNREFYSEIRREKEKEKKNL